jgi:Co/Zn/Cd efflux system component
VTHKKFAKPSKKKIRFLEIAGAVLLAWGIWALLSPWEISSENIAKLEGKELSKDRLRVTGVLTSTAKGISRIENRREDTTLHVRVLASRTSKQNSGHINHVIQLRPNLQRVTIGKDKAILWEKASGPDKN